MPADFTLQTIMEYSDRSAPGLSKTEQSLSSLERASKQASDGVISIGASAGRAEQQINRFSAGAEAAYAALLKSDRAAQMSSEDIGKLASSLGVASQAEVDATLKMDRLVAAWNKGEISSEQFTAEVKDLEQSLDQSGESAKEATGAFDQLGTALTAAAIIGAGKAAYELGELGAQSIRTRNAFDAISGSAEEAEARLDAMQRATRGALSEQEAMAAANRLMQMGLADSAESLGEMTGMAVRLGGAMGKDASGSIEEFALLLANQSIPRLDTFGISASAVRTRITELQAATEGITREQAFLQAVNEQGAIAMARLGDATEDEALQFERVTAQAADFKAELGERLAPAIADVLEVGMKLLTWSEDLHDALDEHADDVLTTSESYEDYVAELERAAEAASLQVDEQGRLVDSYNRVHDANYVLSEATWEASRAQEAFNTTVEQMAVSIAPAPDQILAMRDAAQDTTGPVDELAQAGGRVARSFGEIVFDEETLWNMALASGASVEALSQLATTLGIATDAEIQLALKGQELVEQLTAPGADVEQIARGWESLSWAQEGAAAAAGVLAAEQDVMKGKSEEVATALGPTETKLRDTYAAIEDVNIVLGDFGTGITDETIPATDDLTERLGDMEMALHGSGVVTALEDANAELDIYRTRANTAKAATDPLARSIHVLAERIGGAAGYAKNLGDELRNIPTSVTIDIYVNQHGSVPKPGGPGGLQSGTSFHRGGDVLVGELGPELVRLPRGAQVFSWSAPETRQAIDQRSYGGDTYVINNEMVWALVKEQKRLREIEQMELRM